MNFLLFTAFTMVCNINWICQEPAEGDGDWYWWINPAEKYSSSKLKQLNIQIKKDILVMSRHTTLGPEMR